MFIGYSAGEGTALNGAGFVVHRLGERAAPDVAVIGHRHSAAFGRGVRDGAVIDHPHRQRHDLCRNGAQIGNLPAGNGQYIGFILISHQPAGRRKDGTGHKEYRNITAHIILYRGKQNTARKLKPGYFSSECFRNAAFKVIQHMEHAAICQVPFVVVIVIQNGAVIGSQRILADLGIFNLHAPIYGHGRSRQPGRQTGKIVARHGQGAAVQFPGISDDAAVIGNQHILADLVIGYFHIRIDGHVRSHAFGQAGKIIPRHGQGSSVQDKAFALYNAVVQQRAAIADLVVADFYANIHLHAVSQAVGQTGKIAALHDQLFSIQNKAVVGDDAVVGSQRILADLVISHRHAFADGHGSGFQVFGQIGQSSKFVACYGQPLVLQAEAATGDHIHRADFFDHATPVHLHFSKGAVTNSAARHDHRAMENAIFNSARVGDGIGIIAAANHTRVKNGHIDRGACITQVQRSVVFHNDGFVIALRQCRHGTIWVNAQHLVLDDHVRIRIFIKHSTDADVPLGHGKGRTVSFQFGQSHSFFAACHRNAAQLIAHHGRRIQGHPIPLIRLRRICGQTACRIGSNRDIVLFVEFHRHRNVFTRQRQSIFRQRISFAGFAGCDNRTGFISLRQRRSQIDGLTFHAYHGRFFAVNNYKGTLCGLVQRYQNLLSKLGHDGSTAARRHREPVGVGLRTQRFYAISEHVNILYPITAFRNRFYGKVIALKNGV